MRAVRALSGRGVLLWLLAFFVPVILVNVWFIVVSVQTFSGEDEQKPYLQGVSYNQTLARREEQRRLGWHMSVSAQRTSSGHLVLDIVLRSADGSPRCNEKFSGELRHPADELQDKALVVTDSGTCHYTAQLNGVSHGAWDVVLSTPGNAVPFEASTRLWLP
jgi:nitrogen fixation protein FixH